MKTTSMLLTACATAAFGLSSASGLAGPLLDTTSHIATIRISQVDPAQEANELLRQARQLISEGNFAAAESFVVRAEKLGAQPGLFQVGDTPAKVRQELNQRRGAAPAGLAQPQPYPQTTALPPAAQASPEAMAAAQNPAVRAQSDAFILESRKALSTGDVRRASEAIYHAKNLGVAYSPQDDSPARVEAAIRKHLELNAPNVDRTSDSYRRQQNDWLMEQAVGLLRFRQFDDAERLANDARSLGVTYNSFETRPDSLLEQIHQHRRGQATATAATSPVAAPTSNAPDWAQQAGGVVPAAGVATPVGPGAYPGATAAYNPGVDATRTVMASDNVPVAQSTVPAPEATSSGNGERLFQQGQQALRESNVETALQHFREAFKYEAELDPLTRHRLKEHLQLLSVPSVPAQTAAADPATSQQQMQARQISIDVNRQLSEARASLERDPKKSLEMLKAIKSQVESNNEIEAGLRSQIISRVDLSMREVDTYIAQNQSRIELDSANKAVRDEIEQRRLMRVEVDDKLATLVDNYNRLMDEGRYPEAEVLAKQAAEIAPDSPLVVQLREQSRVMRRVMENTDIRRNTERGVFDSLQDVANSATPFVGPYEFPDAKSWEDLTKRRSQREAEGTLRRSPRELEIARKLDTPVAMKFNGRPLSEVLDYLAKVAQINMFIDPAGLSRENITTDVPVTIDLSQDISMKSALALVLTPLHLSYVIENDVLKITSERMRQGKVYPKPYYVADLVIPIPNFAATDHTSMVNALQRGYNQSNKNGFVNTGHTPISVSANTGGSQVSNAMVNPALLAQMSASGLPVVGGGAPMQGVPMQGYGGAGNAGLPGGSQADFEQLIDLITTTIRPESWDEPSGGPGSIREFENNLSLVISNTQEVHEEIADLLQQIRRLQDLQVTIEVRFITLRDDFFEQIGVDFDLKVDDKTPRDASGNPIFPKNGGSSVTVGLDPTTGLPTADLDLHFSQNNATTPAFGGYDRVASTFGFAILSDIEAYFMIEAAQGDNRSNVLQAPKVTLFNGQSAQIQDIVSRPFVTSVTPVVADFAVAQQPVIMVISEGTSLTVQAVVSSDRRFVRMTVVPYFSQIGDVEEFTFEGSKTTRKRRGETTDDNDSTKDQEEEEEIITSGTTVQQPVVAQVTVSTTVSVPDGGTVLLGGIKRLEEGRTERGLPVLSKLPYINRLFRNVSVGRSTSSLMLMVTPRIIIQEEEEERLGISNDSI